MKSILTLLAFIVSMTTALQAQAYFVGIQTSQGKIDYNKSTRILFSGRGTDLGEQPQQSALGRAQLYKRNFPSDQIILISVFENEGNQEALTKKGWSFPVDNTLKLGTEVGSKEILKFSNIRSLEFFGHNSPSLGTQADGLGYRFDFREPIVKTLSSHFAKGAYAIIHGCNSGWLIAQDLSNKWGIAVAGSFTGTRFERLHSDGHFYVDEENRAPNQEWAKFNPDLNEKCSNGGCLRMRPSFSHYNGKWGDFQGPLLSHYKFFCQLDERDCEKAMAQSLYGYLAEKSLTQNSSAAEFSQVAKEWLCPVYKVRDKAEDCLKQLGEIEAGRGNLQISYVVGDAQLTCTLKSCKAVMTCDDHNCKVTNRSSKDSQTIAQEYLHLLNGFRALQQDGF
jgi:hypothetical protein